MSWHLTPVYVAEDVIADVWKYDDWGGNVEMRFYKGGKAVGIDPIILPGEWLIALAKKHCQDETSHWFANFVGRFVLSQEIPVTVSARYNLRDVLHSPQVRSEGLTIKDKPEYNRVTLSYPDDWEGTLQLEYYNDSVSKSIPIESYEVPCAWVLGVARFGYWVILKSAFMNAADHAEQDTPEKGIYAWDEWEKRKKR